MNKKTVKVYNTFTGKMVDVEVTPEIYEAYTRTEWGIKNNDNSFYEHEIQFTLLIGGEKSAYENFHEFILDGDPTADNAIRMDNLNKLRKSLEQLDTQDLELITLIYYCGMSEKEYAEKIGTSQQNIHKKKKRILANLYKLIETAK